jgi:hypothetical protein
MSVLLQPTIGPFGGLAMFTNPLVMHAVAGGFFYFGRATRPGHYRQRLARGVLCLRVRFCEPGESFRAYCTFILHRARFVRQA